MIEVRNATNGPLVKPLVIAFLALTVTGCTSISCPQTTSGLGTMPGVVGTAAGLVELSQLSQCHRTREEVTVDLDALREDIARSKEGPSSSSPRP
jgi:hypothetical protein